MTETNGTPITARTGPMPIERSNELLASQKSFLRRILMQIRQIAEVEAQDENDESSRAVKDGERKYRKKQLYRRPHQVFLIDGARGAGKTTLLLTVQQYLKRLGTKRPLNTGDKYSIEYTLKEFEDKICKELDLCDKKSRPFRFVDAHMVGGSERKTVRYLDIIFPTEFETGQKVLEGVLALMVRDLNNFVERSKEKTLHKTEDDEKSDPVGDSQRVRDAKKLINQANQEVAKGWFLSKNAGQDAILQDSIDYKDFLSKKSEANVASFARIDNWRAFVNDYLNFFAAELLAVFFDDTDVKPESTEDILHTIRIFLDHPRIVTIIAGNLRSIRQDMVLRGMETLRAPIDALTQEAESTAKDWRQFVRHQVEESLEKVMPRQFRYFLTFSSDSMEVPRELEIAEKQQRDAKQNQNDKKCEDGDSGPGAKIESSSDSSDSSDFRRVFGMGFDMLCGQMLDDARDDFLIQRHKAHFRQLVGRKQTRNEEEASKLEAFVSWWMFRHWYSEELRPQAVRHLAALKAFVLANPDSQLIGDKLPSEHKKRLAVILFESPNNHALIHRLGDEDARVLRWLHRQVLSSSWRGDRYIEINQRRIYERTYSYNFLQYRLDLGIGLPVTENPEERIPKGILPTPSGPNLIGYRPFFPRMRRQRLYGVANGLQHTLVPANCIYFSDLVSLPDVAWADPAESQPSEPWGSQIVYNWPNHFFFDVEELSDPRGPEPGPFRSKAKEKWIRDYFVDVVLPFSSADMGRYARTPNNHDDADTWGFSDAWKRSLLNIEIKGPFADKTIQFSKPLRTNMSGIQRRLDFISTSATNWVERFSISKVASDERIRWKEEVLDQLISPKLADETLSDKDRELDKMRSHLASYQWLVNDARRAWHAGRVFLNKVSGPLTKASSGPKQENDSNDTAEVSRRDTFERSDRYTIPTSESFHRWLDRSEKFRQFMDSYRTKVGLNPSKTSDEGLPHITSKPNIRSALPVLNFLEIELGVRLGVPEGQTEHFVEGQNKKEFFWVDLDWIARRVSSDARLIAGCAGKEESVFIPGHTAHLEWDASSLSKFLKNSEKALPREETANWPLFIDPATTQTDKDDKGYTARAQKVLDIRTYARLSRTFLFFLYGVSPTLPSLIHIELASVLKSAADKDCSEYAWGVLDVWLRRTIDFLCFVQSYRRVLEIAKLRLDVMTLCLRGDTKSAQWNELRRKLEIAKWSPSECGVRLALTPDVDFGTLGVKGIASFGGSTSATPLTFSDGILEPLENEWQAFLKGREKQESGDVRWRPMIETTVENLVETLNFIMTMQQVLRDKFPQP